MLESPEAADVYGHIEHRQYVSAELMWKAHSPQVLLRGVAVKEANDSRVP